MDDICRIDKIMMKNDAIIKREMLWPISNQLPSFVTIKKKFRVIISPTEAMKIKKIRGYFILSEIFVTAPKATLNRKKGIAIFVIRSPVITKGLKSSKNL